ncbi:hypothetical protein ANN_08355 [Periplaneta americana]|uniref:Uncharacterized protein n=1 Tax=Periplaneta americana TaxID=6978 RepID=A0ABQ8T165_PERAM|nr:hypothetical protein ANN_08355 [Periplaneta americana]
MAGLCDGGNEPPGSLKASKHISGQSFLRNTSPPQHRKVYRNILSEWLLPQLEEEVPNYILQQDGAPAHCVEESLVTLNGPISSEAGVEMLNSAKIPGKQAVTLSEEEIGVTRTGIQQAQQNLTSVQSKENSGRQMGAIPKRVKELRHKSRRREVE